MSVLSLIVAVTLFAGGGGVAGVGGGVGVEGGGDVGEAVGGGGGSAAVHLLSTVDRPSAVLLYAVSAV